MEIKLKRMTLRNFKSIRSLDFDFRGEDAIVIGSNGTGKTTLYDAYLWCIFGTTSGVNAQVQMLDKDNVIVHKIDTEVSVVLTVNGDYDVTVGRKLTEKWKALGTPDEKFSGTEVQRFINDVPLSMKEFNAKLQEIADLKQWLMLSSIESFMSLKMDERRKILMSIAGGIDEAEVMKPYPAIIQAVKERKSLEELQKQTKSIRKRSDDELKGIPQAIDAQDRLRVNEDFSALREQKQILEEKIEDVEKELQASNEELSAQQMFRTRLAELEEAARTIKRQWEEDYSKDVSVTNKKRIDLEYECSKAAKEIEEHGKQYDANVRKMNALQQEFNDKKQQWKDVNEEEFNFQQTDVCPLCHHPYTEETKREQRENAVNEYNRHKSERLQKLQDEIMLLKEQITVLKGLINEYDQVIRPSDKNLLDAKQEALNVVVSALERLKTHDVSRYEPYQKALADIEAHKNSVQRKDGEDTTERKETLRQLKAQRDEILNKLSGERTNKKIEEERERLSLRSTDLAQIIADCDNTLWQIKEYKKARIEAVESCVNGFFEIVKWKFYEKNVSNDDEKEICTCLVGGVDYDNLNTASKINVGVDIINGLSKAYQIFAPLFVDNRESAITLLPSKSQIISLKVVENESLTLNINN